MTRFQEDTARYLFRMQIVGPDGQPFTEAPKLERTVPAAPPVESAALAPPPSLGSGQFSGGASGQPSGQPREIPVPTRAPTTTIDALEKEFERKKQRELSAARMADQRLGTPSVMQNAAAIQNELAAAGPGARGLAFLEYAPTVDNPDPVGHVVNVTNAGGVVRAIDASNGGIDASSFFAKASKVSLYRTN